MAAVGLLALSGCSTPEPSEPVAEAGPQPQVHRETTGTPTTIERPNILLIDIDSLRADRVSRERDGTAVAPILRNLTRNGAHFELAFSQSGWTMPAIAAILTGRYPVVAPPGGEMTWIEQDVRTLPEILGLYDYHSAVFWGGTLASDYQAASQGFDEVHRKREDSDPAYHEPIASWLRSSPPEPFFAFLHNLDLHAPVPRPPDDALHRWHEPHDACAEAPHLLALQRDLEDSLGLEGSVDHAQGHYDATLLHYNHSLRLINEALRDTGLGPRTVLVVTSNHGEDLYEHGTIDHSLLYDTVLHVPLLYRDPKLPNKGEPVDQPVQAIDIAPTLLERVGIAVDHQMDGQSLLPLLGLSEGAYESRPHFAITSTHNATVRHQGHKLILTNFIVERDARGLSPRLLDEPSVEPHLELYDLAADPGEQHDLIDEREELARELDALLKAWLAQHEERVEGASPIHVDDRAREVLQERGYWELAVPGEQPPTPPASGR